jgi:hypothetical protein
MTFNFDDFPLLPYGWADPSSGFSGSDTSAARATSRDKSGKTAKTQEKLLALVAGGYVYGVTVAEARDALEGIGHHGTISGALSNLHKAGPIDRLTTTRNRCKVYVLPENVRGRDTEPQGRQT